MKFWINFWFMNEQKMYVRIYDYWSFKLLGTDCNITHICLIWFSLVVSKHVIVRGPLASLMISEVLGIFFHVSAYTTTNSVFFAVWRMIHFNWTPLFSRTLWQLIPWFSRYIITAALLFVARLTEMSVSPAEPLSYWAAEFALILNEFQSMCFTIFDAPTDTNSGTLTAY